jgi:hypothetical protein
MTRTLSGRAPRGRMRPARTSMGSHHTCNLAVFDATLAHRWVLKVLHSTIAALMTTVLWATTRAPLPFSRKKVKVAYRPISTRPMEEGMES